MVSIDKDSLELSHRKSHTPCGGTMPFNSIEELIEKNRLGIDITHSSIDIVEKRIGEWTKRKKAIGALLLDQSEIAGIGLAWACEILHQAKIAPDAKANLLSKDDVKKLAVYTLAIRNISIDTYMEHIDELYINGGRKAMVDFINRWFRNLYKIRTMEAYQNPNSEIVHVAGRRFCIVKPKAKE
jgi:formamidopyrimidine-DNA glycosylase